MTVSKVKINFKDLYEFTKSNTVHGIHVKTETGLEKLNDVVKKENVKTVKVEFTDHSRIVAETHRFRDNGKEVYAKDAKFVDTLSGNQEEIINKTFLPEQTVYDIMIPAPHWYIDQYGIIHHNTGKSLGLCSLAADYLLSGKNVIYISMEMSETVCAKRIDANLLDISLDDLDKIGDKNCTISYQEFKNKMENIKNKSAGRLKIKQYPTGAADVNNFRAYVNELKIKDNFIPDVIMIDYLGICASSRIKTFSENSYTLVKAIAEELRGFAVETKTVMWSAAQTTRQTQEASDISMGDVAESYGLAHTVDFLLGGIETEEHKAQGVQMFKQLKSRYGDKDYYNKFNLGVMKGNQRWVELEESIQETQEPKGSSTRSKINNLNLDDMKF